MADVMAQPQMRSLSDEPYILGFIGRFSTAIAERPVVFATALESLGEAATAQSVELSDEQGALPMAVSEEDMILAFFTYRLDRHVEFDESTEEAIGHDDEYAELLQRHKDTHSVRYTTGKVSSAIRENPSADAIRNAARRASLAFFINRTMLWRGQREQAFRLPSAG